MSLDLWSGTATDLVSLATRFPPHRLTSLPFSGHGHVQLMCVAVCRQCAPSHASMIGTFTSGVRVRFREVFAAFSARGIVIRRLERMPCGLAEFEITDQTAM